jgi:PAS domain S-box-containing protein
MTRRDEVEAISPGRGQPAASLSASPPTLFHAIAELCPIGIFAADTEGACLYANDRWQEITGLVGPKALGHGWVDALHPDDRTDVFRAWSGAVIGGREFSARFRFLRSDGSVRHVLSRARPMRGSRGEVTSFVGTVEDETERDAAERALRESEGRLARVLAGSNDGYWEWDLRSGTVERSPSLLAILGFDEGGLSNAADSFLRLIHPEDEAVVRRGIGALLAGHAPAFEAELRVRRADGRWIWVLDRGRITLRDAGGRPLRVSGTFLDIDERVRAREAMAQARDMALEAARAKTDFLANISHEIRTPLHGVLGMADLLLGTALTEAQRDQAETIRRSGESLLRLLNDILEFTRLGKGTTLLESRVISVREIVDDSLRSVAGEARVKNLELRSHVDEGVPTEVIADPLRLRQVLLGLCGNAVKFTESGHVAVGVTVEAAEGETLRLLFDVRDTGMGIPEEMLKDLFEPFHQVDGSMTRRFGGSGLGLALVRGHVEAWSGRVWIESVPGQGTRVAFTLPALRPAPETVAFAETIPAVPGEESARERGRLLLAEDHPVNRKVLRLMAERLGYLVDTVDDGAAATRAVTSGTYDAILMDCQMPVMDGYDATRVIREREGDGHRIPIIAVTAHTMEGDRERALACGMDDYLPKPVRIEDLRVTLERHCPKPSA